VARQPHADAPKKLSCQPIISSVTEAAIVILPQIPFALGLLKRLNGDMPPRPHMSGTRAFFCFLAGALHGGCELRGVPATFTDLPLRTQPFGRVLLRAVAGPRVALGAGRP
jgi:hypothetical protein